jgi:hypothetical protein
MKTDTEIKDDVIEELPPGGLSLAGAAAGNLAAALGCARGAGYAG